MNISLDTPTLTAIAFILAILQWVLRKLLHLILALEFANHEKVYRIKTFLMRNRVSVLFSVMMLVIGALLAVWQVEVPSVGFKSLTWLQVNIPAMLKPEVVVQAWKIAVSAIFLWVLICVVVALVQNAPFLSAFTTTFPIHKM